ncbi:hypothetical protein BOX15_Mlig001288g3 [Macrostomum lignano]|uniref:Uncharacterized protein n=1 Tax=Macrostomum lignano TaxID=282301 RepID=A0A267HA83_9PLAT|nr:hypothetical protein BOX15_Mlig001288g3 [Macrostomum lignano]
MSQQQVASSGDMSQRISNASVTPATVSIYYCDRNRVGRQPLGTGRLLSVQIDTDFESNEHLLALVQPDQAVRSRLLAWPESVKRNGILLGFYTANINKAASSKVAATSKTIKESAATSSTPELMKWFETSNITETIKDSGTSKTPETIKELAATSKTSETIKVSASSKTPETIKEPVATLKTLETIKEPAETSKTSETIKESAATSKTSAATSKTSAATSKTSETIKEPAATSKTSETIKEPVATSKTSETIKESAATSKTSGATSKTSETMKEPAATSKTSETIKESSNSVAGMLGRIGYGYLLNCCNKDCSLLKFTVVKSLSASKSKNRLKLY